MRLALLLVVMSGCSFVWREKIRSTCSSTPMHVDLPIAGAAALGAGAAALAITCNDEECNQQPMVNYVIGPALAVGVAALASAAYGYSLRDECEAKKH